MCLIAVSCRILEELYLIMETGIPDLDPPVPPMDPLSIEEVNISVIYFRYKKCEMNIQPFTILLIITAENYFNLQSPSNTDPVPIWLCQH